MFHYMGRTPLVSDFSLINGNPLSNPVNSDTPVEGNESTGGELFRRTAPYDEHPCLFRHGCIDTENDSNKTQ